MTADFSNGAASRKWERMIPYPAIQAADKIQWDLRTGLLKPLDPLEQSAFVRLQGVVRNAPGSFNATVTGRLRQSTDGIVLEVRQFSVPGEVSTNERAQPGKWAAFTGGLPEPSCPEPARCP